MWNVRRYRLELLAAPMTLDFILGEVEEMVAAAREGSLPHVWEEWNDVMLCTMCWVSQFVPFFQWMPILPGLGLSSVKKFAARVSTWEQIFAHHGLVFHMEYVCEGSNFRKQHKVKRVLALGGCSVPDLPWVETRVGGFEA